MTQQEALARDAWAQSLKEISRQNAFIDVLVASKKGREDGAKKTAAALLRKAFHASPEVAEARRAGGSGHLDRFNEVARSLNETAAPSDIGELERLLGVMGYRLTVDIERIENAGD